MLFSFVYLVFVSLLKLLIGGRRPAQVKDLELIVLRHQIDVLRRQVERQRCEPVTAPSSPRQAGCSRPSAIVVCS